MRLPPSWAFDVKSAAARAHPSSQLYGVICLYLSVFGSGNFNRPGSEPGTNCVEKCSVRISKYFHFTKKTLESGNLTFHSKDLISRTMGADADVRVIPFRISTAELRECKIASATIVCQLVLRNSFHRGPCYVGIHAWACDIKSAATSQVPNQT